MRSAPYIWDTWSSNGPFVGDKRPVTRVTVQGPWPNPTESNPEDYVIRTTNEFVGIYTSRGMPLRYFDRVDGDDQPVEIEIHNVKAVQWDRSIDTDAATCTIQIYNQQMNLNSGPHQPGQLGQPGYFTWNRGKDLESFARWGHEPNDWEDVLVPNALIRTYQGFGGWDKTLEDAIDDGNLIVSGTWLIDEVRVDTNGMITLQCRDMMKLLIVQQLYPPLVPASKYPLKYCRWSYEDRAINAAAAQLATTGMIAAGNKNTVYETSSTDAWYGYNFLLHGHRGTDSTDGNIDTYALSVGNSAGDKPFAYDYFQYICGEPMDTVYVHPWGGNYQMFISVMEGGVWQGTDVIPYNFAALEAVQPGSTDTGADIPYVAVFGVPYETAAEYRLPRLYNAERVRITFHFHQKSPWGPWYYRVGVREFRNRASSEVSQSPVQIYGSTEVFQPLFFAADSLRDQSNLNAEGYWTESTLYQNDWFGDARGYSANGTASSASVLAIAMRQDPDTHGYYVLSHDGIVLTFGSAVHQGDPKSDPWFPVPSPINPGGTEGVHDIAITHTGDGYWVVSGTGQLFAYGDAVDYTSQLTPTGNAGFYAIESHPTAMGLWAMDTNGKVTAFGAATDFGDFSEVVLNHDKWGSEAQEAANNIRSTMDGTGYWIMTTAGRVQAFGSATEFGQMDPITVPTNLLEAKTRLFPTASDQGYWIIDILGNITPFGDADFFGSPIPGGLATLRNPGNYTDYSEIIRDLVLWSGFLALDNTIGGGDVPDVLGGIETTGAYSDMCLPDEMFDKKPVIDPINELKEIVGYIVFCTEEGGFIFRAPNWWSAGNFDENGAHTNFVPDVDERVVLTNYGISFNDDALRSMIIISSDDPNASLDGTLTTKFVPSTAPALRGLVKPAMWVNGLFVKPEDQRIMAELISLHIGFSMRVGQAQCAPLNPALQIDDQIRILERQTGETFLHYVRGISSSHDLDTGQSSMTITTHWLTPLFQNPQSGVTEDYGFAVSADLRAFINRNAEKRGLLDDYTQPTYITLREDVPGDGSAEI